MPETIYIRGGMRINPPQDMALDRRHMVPEEWVWQFAHPRGPRPTGTTLTLFDYTRAEVQVWEDWDGDQPPKPCPTTQRALDPPSVLSLYEHLKEVGTRAPQSVTELHFFTHGFPGGPILINTDEPGEFAHDPANRNRRHRDDLDPRIKDFADPNVCGGREQIRLRAAFAPMALIKLWGCAYEDVQEYRDRVREYVATRDVRTRRRLLREYIRFVRDYTYQFALHQATGLRVYAAPLGWGTNPYLPDGGRYAGVWPPRDRDRWWRVSPHFSRDRGDLFYRRDLHCDDIDPVFYVAYSGALLTELRRDE